jgi:LPS-assembly lipoprotein
MRILILLLTFLLSACGFKPSNIIELSQVQTPFSVSAKDPYSSLADNIERTLSAGGAQIARSSEASNVISISNELIETKALSLDQNAQVREYVMRYRVVYSLLDVSGKTLIDDQVVELSRDFSYDINTSAGSPAEQELLKREMQTEMIKSILRRSSIVLQAQAK